MRKFFERLINDVFRLSGFEIKRITPAPKDLLAMLFKRYCVDMVFDVGANAGMSGNYFRSIGYNKTIVSFEPVQHLFTILNQLSSNDPNWFCENIALGDVAGELVINVTGSHGGASSLLKMTDELKRRAPDQNIISRDVIPVTTMNEMASHYYPIGDRLFVKLDVQGYEKNVLEGAQACIDRVIGMKIEMSISQQYEGEPLIYEMLPYLYRLGFRLVGMEPGWSDPVTQEILQIDGILFRTNRLALV